MTCGIPTIRSARGLWNAAAPLGAEYQDNVRRAFQGGWIDVFENAGKRSGAYSAPVYGTHPYMLLNYNETLDAVFHARPRNGPFDAHTCCRIGHNHSCMPDTRSLSPRCHRRSSEAALLDLMLDRARTRPSAPSAAARDRGHYRHVLYPGAVCRLRAAGPSSGRTRPAGHRGCAEHPLRVPPIASTNGDVIDEEEISRVTWSRIPHFFSTPVLRVSLRVVLRFNCQVDAGTSLRATLENALRQWNVTWRSQLRRQ
jgi:oligoendopeptidase F